MDFELSEDQLALQAAARNLLDDRADPQRVRAHLSSGQPFDTGLWRAMAEQGWLGVALPESQGGIGMTWVEAAVLLEEIGRHTAPVPFLPSLLALAVLASAERGPTNWVADLAGGERIGCVGWNKDPDAVTAVDSGGQWQLSGRVGPVEAAAVADVAVVATWRGVFAVDLASIGRPLPEPAMDGTRVLSWLTFDDTPATLLEGDDLVVGLLDRGAVGAAAELLGGAGRVLEMAAQYAKDRVQFDQPIGSFQAVKHRCADMVVDVEGMRSSTWYAAWAIAAGEADASIAASTAKVWCSDAAKRVMASGLQVHGGIGFTWEHDLHLFMKRSQFAGLSYGDAAFHRDRVAEMLRARLVSGVGVF
ncbi:MAG TPA: acyl-CoA dehydrogenase family protein [Acidimicrobiales bacterium]|jgi:alkylation response protein AidB-like acyl-CoA dehydrogenase|nr:acyl-CoA dehydrogenase family protein [Acidimicrobiales bacterium]